MVQPAQEQPDNPWIEAKRVARATPRPSRERAWKAVKAALKAGVLTRLRCELELPGCVHWPTQAHHKSYDPGRELDVVWLCGACHNRHTARATTVANKDRARKA